MPVHEAWVLGALIMLIGLILGNLAGQWWARRQPGDDCGEDHVEIWREGYEQGCDDELASCAAADRHEDVPRPGQDAERDDTRSITVPGRTIYAELATFDAQEELAEVFSAWPAVDPDWHPVFLARSEAWLADTRAELGLVAA